MASELRCSTGAALIDGTGTRRPARCDLRIADGRVVAVWQRGESRRRRLQAPAAQTSTAAARPYARPDRRALPYLVRRGPQRRRGRHLRRRRVGRRARGVERGEGAAERRHELLRPGLHVECRGTCRDAIDSGMFPGPRIFAAGRHIAADGGFADYFPSWLGMPPPPKACCAPRATRCAREVRRQVKNRVDLVKISGDSQAQERDPAPGRASPTRR